MGLSTGRSSGVLRLPVSRSSSLLRAIDTLLEVIIIIIYVVIEIGDWLGLQVSRMLEAFASDVGTMLKTTLLTYVLVYVGAIFWVGGFAAGGPVL